MTDTNVYLAPARMLRTLSVLNLVLTAILFNLLCPGAAIVYDILGLYVSSSILLMIPDTYKDRRLCTACGLVSMVLALSAELTDAFVLDMVTKPVLSVIVCPLAASLPLSVCLVCRVVEIYRDSEYLTMKVSGWELMLCIIKGSYIAIFYTIFTFAILYMLFLGVEHSWLSIVATVLGAVFFLLLFVRSITGRPIVSYTDAGTPECVKDAGGTGMEEKAGALRSGMYSRLIRHIEDKRPFLDPGYGLEDLARDLCSNKAYVSKVINEGSGLNFCQLMNRYRVDYAREAFRNDSTLKVRDLSELSGFNSQVTFNMAFRLFYETTPGVWCKEVRDGILLHPPPSSPQEQERKLPQALF